jgi:hypothetical protein
MLVVALFGKMNVSFSLGLQSNPQIYILPILCNPQTNINNLSPSTQPHTPQAPS